MIMEQLTLTQTTLPTYKLTLPSGKKINFSDKYLAFRMLFTIKEFDTVRFENNCLLWESNNIRWGLIKNPDISRLFEPFIVDI